jgi:hypothetical protein
MEPKFRVGQRVKRLEDKDVVGAIVLELAELNDSFSYNIQYDEGVSQGNDGTGWWPEGSLEAE